MRRRVVLLSGCFCVMIGLGRSFSEVFDVIRIESGVYCGYVFVRMLNESYGRDVKFLVSRFSFD